MSWITRRAPAARWALRIGLTTIVGAGCLGAGTSAAHANRFGPPWQAEAVGDDVVVYAGPGADAAIVGPVPKDSVVVVLEALTAADGTDWYRTREGFVRGDDVAERDEPWVAEVTAQSVSVVAKPWATSGVRRTVARGELLRVTGVSPGLEGDAGIWWATTDGYVPLDTLRQAGGQWAASWTVPDGSEAKGGWWGAIRSQANVRAGATTEAPVVGTLGGGTRVKVLAEEQGQAVGGDPTWYRIDGGRYAGGRVHASLIGQIPGPRPNDGGPSASDGRGLRLVVDRGDSSLTVVRDGQPELSTFVSLGNAGTESPSGRYATLGKYRADDMTSTSIPNPTDAYDLPNVPFTQYYKDGGYAIHGTYWHDQFGANQSHGCINLTWGDAAYLFGLTSPSLARGTDARWVDPEYATPVVIVD